jgi:hypothetical protein
MKMALSISEPIAGQGKATLNAVPGAAVYEAPRPIA